MRAEKKLITEEYVARLNASPFFLVVDYKGLSVGQFTELRKRLRQTAAEVHVVKNSIFRAAAQEAGVANLQGVLKGQLAVITGDQDISAAAKVVKTFKSEFERPHFRVGYLGDEQLDAEQLTALADLPSLEVLRGVLLGLIQEPATRVARLVQTPGTELARVIQARIDQQDSEA